MADQKTTQLTALTTPDPADLLFVIDDVAGTPTSKKITYANLVLNVGNTFTKTQTITPSPAADSLYLTGSIGIGTTDPNKQVDFTFPGVSVHMTDATAATFMAETSGGYCGYGLLDRAAGTDAKYFELQSKQGSGRVYLVSADTTTYDLFHTLICGLPTGEVGIADTIPTAGAYKLQVGGGIKSTDDNLLIDARNGSLAYTIKNTDAGADNFGILYFADATSDQASFVAHLGTGTTGYYGGARSMVIGTGSTATLGLVCNSVERMRMNTTGAIMPSSAVMQIGSSTFASPDVGWARNAAGVLEINSSSAGTLRDLKLRNVVGQTGYSELVETTAPGGGGANTARIYAVDNGSGKTQLMVVFQSGAAIQLAIEA